MTRPRGRPPKAEEVKCELCNRSINLADAVPDPDDNVYLCQGCVAEAKSHNNRVAGDVDEDDDEVEELEFGEDRERDLGGEEDE